MREGIGRAGGGSGGGGMGVFGDAASLPRPSKYSNVMYSDPLIKSTSEDDFSNRNSSASVASPGYYSDRIGTTLSPESSPYTMSPWNRTPSPLTISPWSHSDTINPFASATSDVSTSSLFPPGTGLVGSLVREEGHIYSLAAAGDLLYTGSDSKNIRVWKNQMEHSGFKAGSGLVKAIVLSGDRVFTGHQDGKIRVWKPSPKNPQSHKRVSTLPRLKDFLKSSLNPTNYVEARRRNHRSAVWIRHADAVSCLSPSEDHSLLYSGSWDRTIKVWRVADSRCLESIGAHDDAVNSVVASFDGLVFSGSADGTVKVWRREMTGKGTRHAAVQTLLKQECAVTALAVNRASSVVYCGSSDGVINFWDWERQQLSHGGMLHGHKMAVLCLAVAGSLLFTGSADKTICVWHREDSGAHVCLSVMTGHTGPVKCLAVEADPAAGARMLVVYSGSLDKSVKVWKVADPDPAPADGGRQAPEQLQRRSDTTSSYEQVGGPRFDKY